MAIVKAMASLKINYSNPSRVVRHTCMPQNKKIKIYMYCSFSLPLISLIAIVRIDCKLDAVTVLWKRRDPNTKVQQRKEEQNWLEKSKKLLASTGKKKDERLTKKHQFTTIPLSVL